jgi:ABC-type amino acid transport substrate-binding protein
MRTVTLATLILAVSTTLAAAQDVIKFGYPQTPAGALAVVADKTDLWAKNGVKVQSISFAAGINARDAIISGRLDVGVAGLTNFLSGASEAGLVALGIAVDQCASAAILVKPGSPIRSVGDLKGRRIASQTGTITHSVFANRLLPSAKLTINDVQIVNLRFQDMVSTLAAGSVDAVVAVDPFLSSAEHNGVGRVVTDFCRAGPVPLILAAPMSFADLSGLGSRRGSCSKANRIVLLRSTPIRSRRVVTICPTRSSSRLCSASTPNLILFCSLPVSSLTSVKKRNSCNKRGSCRGCPTLSPRSPNSPCTELCGW